MHNYLEFEKPVADLEGKAHELRSMSEADDSVNLTGEIDRLELKAKQTLADLYKKLTPWQKTLVARHPDRPHMLDYVAALIEDFTPLCDDRNYADDDAVQTGLGRFNGKPIAVIGIERGHDTKTRLIHNFGMARPEGYRKAVRIMKMAERFNLPVLTLVDTTGAYPGVGAEERGQAEAIARSTEACLNLKVPSVCIIIGEGGSGGAIAIAVANRVYMLEHSVYSVISPEGAASILWRDSTRTKDAATHMKITSTDLLALGVIDGVIEEPIGGAHRQRDEIFASVRQQIKQAFAELEGLDGEELRTRRHDKFLAMGRNL